VSKQTVLSVEARENIEESIRDARLALSRVFWSATMMRENAMTPNWDSDLADPALKINQAICFIESALDLEDVSSQDVGTLAA
jgi:hypothetical protein